MSKCVRCGKCCWIQDNKKRWYPCRYLKYHRSITECEIYQHRLGTPLGSGNICTLESIYNIPNCPYNNSKKLEHPFWYKQQVLKCQ